MPEGTKITAELHHGQGSSPKRKIQATPAMPAANTRKTATPIAAAAMSATSLRINA
jgi:hypothetical protein